MVVGIGCCIEGRERDSQGGKKARRKLATDFGSIERI